MVDVVVVEVVVVEVDTCSMHSGTPSWSLSSTAVAPSSTRFFSISSSKSSIKFFSPISDDDDGDGDDGDDDDDYCNYDYDDNDDDDNDDNDDDDT